MDSTDVLRYVGSDGRFQVVFLFAVQSLRILTICGVYFMMFGVYQPPWTCTDQFGLNGNTPPSPWAGTNGSLARGNKYVHGQNISVSADGSVVRSSVYGNGDGGNQTGPVNNSGPAWFSSSDEGVCDSYRSCKKIEFDPDSSTIVTEWELLCETGWIPAMMISLQMIGFLFGSVLGGQLQGRYGRKPVLYGFHALFAVSNFASIVSGTWEVFAALRFVTGFSSGGTISVCVTLSVECVGPKCRKVLSVIPAMGIAASIFSVLAYFIRDWKTLHIVIGALSVVSCIPFMWVPESIRWLYVQGKKTQLEEVAQKIGRFNKKATGLPENFEIERPKAHEERMYGYTDLFRGFRQARISICVGIIWFVRDLVHLLLGFGVKAFAGNFYTNLLMYSMCEIPTFIVLIPVVRYLGNRRGILFFMVIALIASVLILIVYFTMPEDESGMVITYLALLAKLAVSASNEPNMIYSGEVFPTVIRGLGMGFGMACGVVGGAIAPFLIPDTPSSLPICFAIVSGFLLLVCFMIATLPDTAPNRLEDFPEKDVDPEDSGTEEAHAMIRSKLVVERQMGASAVVSQI